MTNHPTSISFTTTALIAFGTMFILKAIGFLSQLFNLFTSMPFMGNWHLVAVFSFVTTLTIFFVYLLHKGLVNAPLKRQKIALAIFALLYFIPIELTVSQEFVEIDGTEIVGDHLLTPATLRCELLSGAKETITNQHIQRAFPTSNDEEIFQVKVELTPQGQELLKNITTANLNQKFGVWVDDQLICAPTIQTPILGGVFLISNGQFTLSEASELSKRLNLSKAQSVN